MKKILSCILSIASLSMIALPMSMPVNAAEMPADIFGDAHDRTFACIYYDKETKEMYISAYADLVKESSYDKLWYYKINEKNKYETESFLSIADGKYYNNGKECTQKDFKVLEYQYEKNDKLVKVDINKKFSEFVPDGYNVSDYSGDDYSRLRDYVLDVQDKKTVTIAPKLLLEGSDIDLKLTWKSSDPAVAEVDSEGKVVAKAEGSCTVTSEIEGIGAVETYNITVEPYMTETEKAVRTIINNYDSGSITEKDMFNQVYALDEYNAAGHVITDIDGDDQYEMVTRSPDKKVIKIYERSGDNIVLAKTLTGVDRANMIYTLPDRLTECCFQTLKVLSNDNVEVKLFKYNGVGEYMTNVLVYTFSPDRNVSNGKDENYCLDSSGNIISDTSSAMTYIDGVWEESFDDSYLPVMSNSATDYVCSGNGNGYAFINTDFSFYHTYRDSVMNSGNYIRYTSKSDLLMKDELREFKQLAVNEILSRYNYAFSDPLSLAIFNRNPSYNADKGVTQEQIFENFNEYEKHNFDHVKQAYTPQV